MTTIPAEDFALMVKADELGRQGLNRIEIADRLGLAESFIRYRLGKYGLELADAGTYVRQRLGKVDLQSLLEAGIIGPAPDESEPVSA